MSGATNTEEAAILNARLDVAGNYVGLFTTLPADDGTGGVEVSGGAYARKLIDATDWSAAVGGAPTVKAGPSGSGTNPTWTFPAPTANWGTIVGWGIFSASTGGTLKYFGALTTTKAVNSGDPAPLFNSTHQILVQLGDVGDTF